MRTLHPSMESQFHDYDILDFCPSRPWSVCDRANPEPRNVAGKPEVSLAFTATSFDERESRAEDSRSPGRECSRTHRRIRRGQGAMNVESGNPSGHSSATRTEDSAAHLSLWKPRRETNWVNPRFAPSARQIQTVSTLV